MNSTWKMALPRRVQWNHFINRLGAERRRASDAAPKQAAPVLKHALVRASLPWSSPSPPQPYPHRQPRVVIVGAGVAGLAAAWRLHHSGITDFLVLEALHRPGGRVHTQKLKDAFLDLGSAELYHCSITNPLFNIAVAGGVVDRSLERKVMGGTYFTTLGDVLTDTERPMEVFIAAMEEAAASYRSTKKSHASVKNVIKSSVEKYFRDKETSDEFLYVINGLENESRVRWGDDLAGLSADYLGSSQEMVRSITKLSKIGASKILQPFLAVVGSKIRYKKPVQSVRWRSDFLSGSLRGGVLCCDGEEFQADFVICTVSLGVLKAQGTTLFSPPLPNEKIQAVERLGFGHVNKIFLEYDRPFWAPSEGTMKIGWGSDDMAKRDSWLKGIGSIEEISPTVLGLSVAGREAVWTESCSDRNIAEEITAFLKKLTGNPTIPPPKSLFRSRWSSDVFFNGAISYLGLESSPGWQAILGEPLPEACCPVLLFAGDATTPGYHGSMTGAAISGIREADRILEVCRRMKGPPRAEKEDDSLKPCPQTVAARPC